MGIMALKLLISVGSRGQRTALAFNKRKSPIDLYFSGLSFRIMPLIIIEQTVIKSYFAIPPDASRFYITVPSSYLSEAYELNFGDRILAKITKVKSNEREFPELEGRTIELIFKSGAIYDLLFISKKDWEENFREYGLVESGFKVSLILNEVLYSTGKKVGLYTKRDIII